MGRGRHPGSGMEPGGDPGLHFCGVRGMETGDLGRDWRLDRRLEGLMSLGFHEIEVSGVWLHGRKASRGRPEGYRILTGAGVASGIGNLVD